MGIEESESIWSSATGGIASWEVMNFDLKLDTRVGANFSKIDQK